MAGRNEPCPCGSKKNYKKCCLDLGSASVQANPSLTGSTPRHAREQEAFNFKLLGEIREATELPFRNSYLGSSPKKILLDIKNILASQVLSNCEIKLNKDEERSLVFSFQEESRYKSYRDRYRSPYGYDGSDEVLVTVCERSAHGQIVCSVQQGDEDIDISEYELLTNAALYLTWLVTANTATQEDSPQFISSLRLDFQRKTAEQENHKNIKSELIRSVQNVKLQSLILVFSNKRADGSALEKSIDFPNYFDFDLTVKSPTKNGLSFFVLDPAKPKKVKIPDLFTGEKREMTYDPEEEQKSKKLADCILYQFDDKSVVRGSEILQSHYALLVPPDLLPGECHLNGSLWHKTHSRLKHSEDYLQNAKRLAQRVSASDWFPKPTTRFSYFYSHIYNSTKNILDQILHSAIQRHHAKKLDFYLTFEAEFNGISLNDTPKLLKLNNICFENESALKTQLAFAPQALISNPPFVTIKTTLGLTLAKEMTSAHTLAMTYGFIDFSKGFMYPHPLADTVSYFKRLDETTYKTEDPDCGFIEVQTRHDPAFEVNIIAHGLKASERILAQLAKYDMGGIEQGGAAPLELQSSPEITMSAEGKFALVRKLSHPQLKLSHAFLTGLSQTTLHLLDTLALGFPHHFKIEARYMATPLKRSREIELKLLKHQGIANLLIFEALSFRIKSQLSDGTKVKNARELMGCLEKKIIALLGCAPNDDQQLSSKGVALLTQLCTKGLYQHLVQFIQDIISLKSTFETFLPEGRCQIAGFIEDELRWLLACLEYAAAASNGEIFMKARVNLREKFLAQEVSIAEKGIVFSAERPTFKEKGGKSLLFALPYSNVVCSPIQSPYPQRARANLQVLEAFQPLASQGFALYLENKRICELGAQDFRAEFNLSDVSSSDGLAVKEQADERVVQLRAQKLNWFDLHPKFFLHGKEVDPLQVGGFLNSGLIEYQGSFFLIPANRLPTLKKLSRFWDRLQRGRDKQGNLRGAESEIYHVPKSQVLELLALRKSGVAMVGGQAWKEVCEFYDNLDSPHRKFVIPNSVQATLKDYQVAGTQRLYDLYRLGLGGILADDMGLGKTLQALSFFEKLRSEDRLGPALIIVPTSLTYNWLSEAGKFTPDLPILAFDSKDKAAAQDYVSGPGQVLIATYGLLQEHREFFEKTKWNIVLFDEAQNLKNIATVRTTAARALAAKTKICLTGTPLENHLGEFYSLVDLVVPGSLGDYDSFRKLYVSSPSVELSDIEYLKLKSRPLILRRSKGEILTQLPIKQETRVVLPFEAKQRKIYRDVALSYNEQIEKAVADKGEASCQLQMLTALLRLRQACSDPGALPGVKYSETPPKIEALAETLKEIINSGASALVFTQFLQTLNNVESKLKKEGISVFVMHGALSRVQREAALTKFNSGSGGAVLLMTLKTGGVGLNLTKASYVFHLEPWWNPAVENQATDRAHRIGQRSAVQVYRYIMHESVEEKIEKLKAQKKVRFDVMFADPPEDSEGNKTVTLGNQSLSRSDFEFLLS